MPDNSVQIRVGADMKPITEAFRGFGATANEGFKVAAGGVEPLNRAILNQHQSIHLLSEEMGVHLPRAVVSGIAEMLPPIANFGGVLLAAFAVQEVPKLISVLRETAASWEGFGKAEQEAMRKAIQDTEILHTKVIDVEKELDLFGKNEADQAAMRAKWAGEDADRALKGALDAEAKVKGIENQIATEKKLSDINSTQRVILLDYEERLKIAQAEAAKAREAWKLSDEQAFLEQKRAREAAEEQAKRAGEATVNRYAEEEKARKQFNSALLTALGEEQVRENALMTSGRQMATERAADDQRWITAHQQVVALLQKEWGEWDNLRAVVMTLTPSITVQAQEVQRATVAFRLHAEASHLAAQAQALFSDINEQALAGLAGLIGGRRAQAGVEAGWEIARGIALLAEGAWPPNPAAIMAAGLHFEAGAQYALLSRSGAGGGGQSGGSYSSNRAAGYGSESGGGNQPYPPQTLAPGAASGAGRFSGTANIVVFGTNHELQNWVARAVNGAVQRGVTVTATSSQRGAPVGH